MTNVLFPTLMEEFHIGTAMVQWLTTGYLLVVSIVTPLSSYLNCFASMSFQQAHQYFSAVWADGFPRSRHHAVSDVR